MRIALVNVDRRICGGVESYLSRLVPALVARGHQLALLVERDSGGGRPAIPLPAQVPAWCVAELGRRRSLAALADFRPDVVFAHGLAEPGLEAATLGAAPCVFFAHSYYGACISGAKTWSRPRLRVCSRCFGPACLLHYFPHGCGGRSPLTMAREYRRQARRLGLLRRYREIVVGSGHMAEEYRRQGLGARLTVAPLPVAEPPVAPAAKRLAPAEEGGPRLLFLGRMEALKGGQVLLAALPAVSRALGRGLRLRLAGDGPARDAWRRAAEDLTRRHPELAISFLPWLDAPARDQLLDDTDLLVVPSLWPEPFGMAGPEAAARGVPAAAFAVGGIPEWLRDGESGALAPPPGEGGEAPEAALAAALVACLADSAIHLRLAEGALRQARSFTLDAHLAKLLPALERAAGGET